MPRPLQSIAALVYFGISIASFTTSAQAQEAIALPESTQQEIVGPTMKLKVGTALTSSRWATNQSSL